MSEELSELLQFDPNDSTDNIPNINNETDNIDNINNESNNIQTSDNESETGTKSKDNLKNFKEKLKEMPEIFDYIVRQGKKIKKLQKKVKKLKNNIKKLCPKVISKTLGTQTVDDLSITNSIKVDEIPKSLTDEIKEAAEDAMLKTGFVFEPTSGMYYDYNTGYYYNAELGMYYDGNSGTYLTYNKETESYDFHSQVSPAVNEESGAKRKKPPKEQVKNYSIDGLLQNFSQLRIDHSRTNALEKILEEGECSDSDSDASEINSICSDAELSEVAQSWPPCMRIILKETAIEKLKIGSLYIITCDGGQIGREGEKSIIIPDINVSKTHAEISFNKDLGQYVITDLGSQNGTILNGKRISAPKKTSDPQTIIHGSVIQFGSTKLLCHIHDGQQTCGHCEPGLIQIEKAPQIDKSLSKNSMHKKELKRLRRKFGLENMQYVDPNLASGYSDRADERRKTVGSQNDNEKTQAASVDESIAPDNKGFKMLAKMGWSQGQSLGKDGTGLTEPVPLVSNEGTAGLGNTGPIPSTLKNPSTNRKATVWKKTQQRYQKIQENNLGAFHLSSDEEET